MFLKLRILFTILCALCLAVVVPVAVWGGLLWLAIVGSAALCFFALMLVCKQAQERAEEEKKPQADFLSPKEEKTDEEEKN